MHPSPRIAPIPVMVATLLCPVWMRAAVKVVNQPASIETRHFDPDHPPREMPPLSAGEAALTVCDFRCDVSSEYRVVDQKRTGDGVQASIKISSVTVTTRLRVTIWLPDRPPAKLVAHEEGHRQIAEMIYSGAEQIARSVGEKMDQRLVSARGENAQTASRTAIEQLAKATSERYLDQTAVKAGRVNDLYDDITAHGLRKTPPEPEAIKQAFARDDNQQKQNEP